METGPETDTEEEQPMKQVEQPAEQPVEQAEQPVEQPIAPRRKRGRPRKHPIATEATIADITMFITQGTTAFANSRSSEINGLLEKGVFRVVNLEDVPQGVRIFNSRFVDEIKHPGTDKAFEKSRLVVQAYNDQGKDLVLTQSPTIQRVSQRIILAITPAIQQVKPAMSLYLRDISQAYVQSNTHLSRDIFIRPPHELGLGKDSILQVVKPLYGVPEAGNHWFNTYHRHHLQELQMTQSTYDPCLLYTSTNGFGVVGLQTDDTLFLADPEFANAEEVKLQKAKFLAKEREQLTT